MAAPAYTTDLTTIVDYDGTSGTAAEPSTGWVAGRSPANNDTDFPIQSSTHASLTMNTTGKAGLLTTGSTFTWTSGHYLFGWITWLAPGAIDSQANGGLAMLCGSSTSNYKVFYVGGSTWGKYPYGGWQNFAVDPTLTYDELFGTVSAYYVVGCGANVLTAVSKGNPLGNDAFRYGRGTLRVANGNVTDGYATFTGMATANDATAARWGLFEAIPGSYKFKGLMYLGYAAATEFTDQNKNIIVDDMIYVNSDFNRIEFHNTSSVIDWTNISITSLSTVSPGQLEMIDDCTFDDVGGVFVDMDTFIYLSGYTGTGRTWRRCGQITQGGATITDCIVENSTAAVAILSDNISLITGTSFTSDGTGHAIRIRPTGAGPFSFTSVDLTYSGYASSDGSTGNECILIDPVTASADVTLSISSGATPTIMEAAGYTGTFTLVLSTYDFTITGLELNTEVTIVTAGTETVLHHTENASVSDGSGKYKVVYTHSGGGSVDVLIHHIDYQPDISNSYGLTLPSANSSTKVAMFPDLNYDNP